MTELVAQPARDRTDGRRRLAPRLAVSAVSFAVALVVGEAWIRSSSAMDRLGWNRVPSVEERIDAVRPRAGGELRLVGLGDSFVDFRDTDGKNFLRVVERELREDGREVVLDNLGQAGAGVVRYGELLGRYLERVTPDVAIVALYLGNDLLDFELDRRRTERGIPIPPRESAPRAVSWKDRLRRRCVLANAVFREAKSSFAGLRSGTYRRNLAAAAELYDLGAAQLARAEARIAPSMVERAEADAINAWDLAFGVVAPELYVRMLALEGGFAEAFGPYAEAVRAIGERCDAAGVRPVFVLIPPSLQLDVRYHDYFRRLGHEVPAELVGDSELARATRELLAAEGWPCLDLRPALAAATETIHIPDDIHWNVAGQTLAGRALRAFLEQDGRLDPPARAERRVAAVPAALAR